MTLPQTADGKCSNCGGTEFFLAKDSTEYTRCEFENDEWMYVYSDSQPTDADDSVRFFCNDCGTRHAVPFEIK